jgi:hypothetical protein
MAKTVILAFCIMALLVLSACNTYVAPAEKPNITKSTVNESKIVSVPKNITQNKTIPTAPKTQPKPAEDITITPVPEKSIYSESESTPTVKKEMDTCGCSFTWEPICMQGRTYINKCIFKCYGYKDDAITLNSQCPKKETPLGFYTDDVAIEYETDEWNSAYCWRDMYRDSGIRYCKNIIVDGRVNTEPVPLKGNWLDESHLVLDRQGRKDSSTIRLSVGEQAYNEEYNLLYQPLFEKGRYRFSFWARQEQKGNNDWKVKLTVKDWWETKPMPVGVKGCYTVMTEISGNQVYIAEQPTEYKHYHYEFDVPLNMSQWSSQKRASSECEYEWDNIPHGYRVEITGPSFGEASFDDFSLQKIS